MSCSSFVGTTHLSDKHFENPRVITFNVKEEQESYVAKLEKGKRGNKYFYRVIMSNIPENAKGPLEKTMSVSKDVQINFNKRKFDVLFPMTSVFTSWVDGHRLSSKITYVESEHRFLVQSKNGNEYIPWTTSENPKVICFFTQIMPCISRTDAFLAKGLAEGESIDFYVIWERYPFLDSFYEGMTNELISPAVLTLEKREDAYLSLNVEVANQILNYRVDYSLDMLGFAWSAQGISWEQEEVTPLKQVEHF